VRHKVPWSQVYSKKFLKVLLLTYLSTHCPFFSWFPLLLKEIYAYFFLLLMNYCSSKLVSLSPPFLGIVVVSLQVDPLHSMRCARVISVGSNTWILVVREDDRTLSTLRRALIHVNEVWHVKIHCAQWQSGSVCRLWERASAHAREV